MDLRAASCLLSAVLLAGCVRAGFGVHDGSHDVVGYKLHADGGTHDTKLPVTETGGSCSSSWSSWQCNETSSDVTATCGGRTLACHNNGSNWDCTCGAATANGNGSGLSGCAVASFLFGLGFCRL